MKNTLFETERLIIRPTSMEDGNFILELLNTPKWKQFIGDRQVHNKKDAENYIATKMLPHLKKYGYANNTVIRKADAVKVGTCGLYNREGIKGVDIGFAFLPQYEGNGYAFEATNGLTNIAFSKFLIPKLNAYTMEENSSSRKLLEKLNFKLIGEKVFPNETIALLMYGLNF